MTKQSESQHKPGRLTDIKWWFCEIGQHGKCAVEIELGSRFEGCPCECHQTTTKPAPDAGGEHDILDDPRVDKEIRRWQDAIRDKLIDLGAPDWKIDGAGCDSGDPLDFTLAEVGQGAGYFVDRLDTLRANTAKLEAAINGLRRGNACWCRTWVGGEHEFECEEITAALSTLKSE